MEIIFHEHHAAVSDYLRRRAASGVRRLTGHVVLARVRLRITAVKRTTRARAARSRVVARA